MDTHARQQLALEQNRELHAKQDCRALVAWCISWLGTVPALFAFFSTALTPTERYYTLCVGAALSMVVCVVSLLFAYSRTFIAGAALTLLAISGSIYLWMPDRLEELGQVGFVMQIGLVVALLCFAGGAVALFKDTLGDERWSAAHQTIFASVMGLLLVFCAWLKASPSSYSKSPEWFDLILAIAGVGFGALLEKKRDGKAKNRAAHREKAIGAKKTEN